ncbi:transglutaminase-like domain-containing protein [Caldimonas brevitalea]|uniref:Transglutaminase n=1 Tax=Caldimonas brevitalea TaxID=413882 RepID=A0A0G3BZE0_9BURK|nr:transglutaminase family protein [Caldimonas brevitalea]AKJ31895.1 transglutaminase [Caldimonas brevitalea]
MTADVAPHTVRIELQIELGYQVDAPGADFIFNIHPAHTRHQAVSAEQLVLNQQVATDIQADPATGNRYLRLRALPGELHLEYRATVDLRHHREDPATLEEVPIHRLPLEVLGYIYPSRYCESDSLLRLATKQFGGLPQGYQRVQSIMRWVQQQISYLSNTSSSTTSAVQSLIDQAGVCRDFAHVMISLCRAVNIPARFVTGTDYGADPLNGPPDFHAYVEAYVGDAWYIFDPSGTGIPMGFVRIGTGRDAADVAFATIFGGVRATGAPRVRAVAVEDVGLGIVKPSFTEIPLSTDAPSHR